MHAAQGGDRVRHRGHYLQVDSCSNYGVRHMVQVQGARMLRKEVTETDIADIISIISKWTL